MSKKNLREKDGINLHELDDRERMYSRFDEHQRALFHSIQENVFTFCEAVTGSGKTTVSVAAMLDMLVNGTIDRIVYVRVADDRSQSIGYYPGTLEEKTDIYWEPFMEALKEMGIAPFMAQQMVTQNQLTMSLDITMRGINLKRAGVIVDEVQNASYDDLKLIYTRCHDDVHVAAIGDGRQRDNKQQDDEWREYCDYLAGTKLGNKCELLKDYRGEFSRLAEEYVPRTRREEKVYYA